MMAGDDEASEKQQSALAARAARAAASLPSFDLFERVAANEAAKEAALAAGERGERGESGDRRAWVPAVSPQGTAFTSRAMSYGDQSEEARARDPLGAFPSTVTTTLTSKGGMFWSHDDDSDGGDRDREPPEAATPPPQTPPPRRRRLKKPTPAADALASLAPILRDSEIRLAAVRARAKEYLGLEVREAFGEGDHALHGW
jgi:hypothetical protein